MTFVPVCNPKAFAQYTREGDRNLNRDLREKPLPQDFEDRIGNRLCSIIRQHDVLLDIHSFKGSGPPFVFFGPENNRGPLEPFRHAEAELAFAAQLGVELLIHGWLGIYEQTITLRNRLDLPKLAVTEGFGTTDSCGSAVAMPRRWNAASMKTGGAGNRLSRHSLHPGALPADRCASATAHGAARDRHDECGALRA